MGGLLITAAGCASFPLAVLFLIVAIAVAATSPFAAAATLLIGWHVVRYMRRLPNPVVPTPARTIPKTDPEPTEWAEIPED